MTTAFDIELSAVTRRRWMRWIPVRVLACLLVAMAGTARAQVGTGQLTGTVTDAGGAAVPGATITAIHVDTAASRRTVSSSAGVYTLAGLPPGLYRIGVELVGFQTVRREGIRIETGKTITLDFALTVGEITESLIVTADAPVLRRATGSLGEIVSQEKIVALPLNGRSFITLASLAPGVALPPASQLPRINGGRPRTNEYLFDGISAVPTLLQRQGIFAEAIAGRVPVIYDPGTTVSDGSGGLTRTPFANGAISTDRLDPVALALLQRYPQPTASGTANNYRRTANETDDQNQFDARIDQRISNGDQVFARLSHFDGEFLPVTPLPDGSGVTTGTLGPQDTKAWSFASSYQRSFSASLLNELRIGDTRRTVARTAAVISSATGADLGIPGIPATARFSNTLPTFLISGYQQLGSPPNTATNFNTSVSEVADTLTWVKGRHTMKMGLDWRWERLNVIQPPSPTGSFTFNALGSDLPGVANTGTPLASFLLGQVQNFSIDVQQSEIQQRARFQEYFIQDDWKVSNRLTIHPGLRYTLNFPSTEINGQTAVFDLQTQLLEYPGVQPVRPLKKNNFGPRLGGVYRMTDKTVASAG